MESRPGSSKRGGRRGRGATQNSTKTSFITVMSNDLSLTVWSFVVPAERFQILVHVCKRWRDLILDDPRLWASVVLTCRVPEYAKLPKTRKLFYTYEPEISMEDFGNDVTLDEYHPNRLSLVGVLPLTPQQLTRIPNPAWLKTLFVNADWRDAGGSFSGEDEIFSAMIDDMEHDDGAEYDDEEGEEEEDDDDFADDDSLDSLGELRSANAATLVRSERREIKARRARFRTFMGELTTNLFDARKGVLRAAGTSLTALHYPLEWCKPYGMEADARDWLSKLVTWLGSSRSRSLEILDMGVVHLHKYTEGHSKELVKLLAPMRKSFAKSLPALSHLPDFDAAGFLPGDVNKWPARFRTGVRTISINVATTGWCGGTASDRQAKATWQLKHIGTLASLFPNLTRLRLEANHLDRELFDALLTLPTSLTALYLCAESIVTPSTQFGLNPPDPAPFADANEWQQFSRFVALEEVVFCFSCFAYDLNHNGVMLDRTLALALPRPANILLTNRSHLLETSVQQIGFDTVYHESGGHEYGGLRPLHRALLPGQLEPWHLHAVEMALDEAPIDRERRRVGPLLLGPLAEGLGPTAWLAEIAEVRDEVTNVD